MESAVFSNLIQQAVQIRKMEKISQKELADKIGVEQSRISYLENGRNVTTKILFKYLEALDITLIVETEDRNEC